VPRDGNLFGQLRRRSETDGRESDDSLLSRVARDESAAWAVLVDRHLGPVTRYANWILRDNAAAEDVAQETFFRLTKKASEWEPGGASLKTWLFRVARNLCIDRKRAKTALPIDTIEDAPDSDNAFEVDRRIDIEKAVQLSLEKLPERQKTAIILVHFEGFSGNEAAKALDISVEAVGSLLARARKALRIDLSGALPDLLGE